MPFSKGIDPLWMSFERRPLVGEVDRNGGAELSKEKGEGWLPSARPEQGGAEAAM